MSIYVLMKILESAPERYDKGINILTMGKYNAAYDRLISHIKRGQNVLDIGCGTGTLTLKAANKGARVKGIDLNAQMLEIAKKNAAEMNLSQNTEFCEMGIAELENIGSQTCDVITSGLCFSELSEDELTYTLNQVKRIVKPDGILLIADEVIATHILKRILNLLIRIPLKAITWVLTQTTTDAVSNLPGKVEQAGFQIKEIRLNKMENFIELKAIKK